MPPKLMGGTLPGDDQGLLKARTDGFWRRFDDAWGPRLRDVAASSAQLARLAMRIWRFPPDSAGKAKWPGDCAPGLSHSNNKMGGRVARFALPGHDRI